MPVISTCPRCQKPVSIPTGIDSTALVRCPLCGVEYPLGDALPPELIPIGVVATGESAWTDAAVESEVAVDGEAVGEEQDTEDNISIPLPRGDELVEAVEDDEYAEYDIVQESEEQIEDEGEPEEDEQNEAAAVVGRVPARVRRRAPKSALQTIVEVVTGGIAGCLVAYYGLAIYFGPQFKSVGLPKLPLPGITWLTTASEDPNDEEAKPAIDEPAATKPSNGQGEPGVSEAPKEPLKASPETPSPPAEQATIAQPAAPPPAEVAASEPEPRPLRPQPGTADYVGPRMPPSITADQLGKALKEAGDSIPADPTGESMSPQVYEAFCRLGEAVAFVNGDASDSQLNDSLDAARALLDRIAGRPELFETLGRLAGERIEAKSGQNTGVLLAGTVKNVARQGRLSGAMIQLAGRSKSVSVLCDRELEAQVDGRAVVLGVVVREPGANLVGYSGSKPAVVWAAALVTAP